MPSFIGLGTGKALTTMISWIPQQLTVAWHQLDCKENQLLPTLIAQFYHQPMGLGY